MTRHLVAAHSYCLMLNWSIEALFCVFMRISTASKVVGNKTTRSFYLSRQTKTGGILFCVGLSHLMCWKNHRMMDEMDLGLSLTPDSVINDCWVWDYGSSIANIPHTSNLNCLPLLGHFIIAPYADSGLTKSGSTRPTTTQKSSPLFPMATDRSRAGSRAARPP